MLIKELFEAVDIKNVGELVKFTPPPVKREKIETELFKNHLDSENVAGAHYNIDHFKKDGEHFINVTYHLSKFNTPSGIGRQLKKNFKVNKDYTLTPVKSL
jgi:hypothetical protein